MRLLVLLGVVGVVVHPAHASHHEPETMESSNRSGSRNNSNRATQQRRPEEEGGDEGGRWAQAHGTRPAPGQDAFDRALSQGWQRQSEAASSLGDLEGMVESLGSNANDQSNPLSQIMQSPQFGELLKDPQAMSALMQSDADLPQSTLNTIQSMITPQLVTNLLSNPLTSQLLTQGLGEDRDIQSLLTSLGPQLQRVLQPRTQAMASLGQPQPQPQAQQQQQQAAVLAQLLGQGQGQGQGQGVGQGLEQLLGTAQQGMGQQGMAQQGLEQLLRLGQGLGQGGAF